MVIVVSGGGTPAEYKIILDRAGKTYSVVRAREKRTAARTLQYRRAYNYFTRKKEKAGLNISGTFADRRRMDYEQIRNEIKNTVTVTMGLQRSKLSWTV